MSGPDKQASQHGPVGVVLGGDQARIEVKEYKRGYFSIVVAMILAKARRECDSTDDITAAVANWQLSAQQSAGVANLNNPSPF